MRFTSVFMILVAATSALPLDISLLGNIAGSPMPHVAMGGPTEDATGKLVDLNVNIDKRLDIPKDLPIVGPLVEETAPGLLDFSVNIDKRTDLPVVDKALKGVEDLVDLNINVDKRTDLPVVDETLAKVEDLVDLHVNVDKRSDLPVVGNVLKQAEDLVDATVKIDKRLQVDGSADVSLERLTKPGSKKSLLNACVHVRH